MVVQGNFSLELINANTMKAFPEHSSANGKTFVTMLPNVDFLVRLSSAAAAHDVQEPHDDRHIVYQTVVSNSSGGSNNTKTTRRHSSKRRFVTSGYKKHSDYPVFRFDRPATKSYPSVVVEKVTVRIYEITAAATSHSNDPATTTSSCPTKQQHAPKRKLLETITIRCSVLPPVLSISDTENLLGWVSAAPPVPFNPLLSSGGQEPQEESKGNKSKMEKSPLVNPFTTSPHTARAALFLSHPPLSPMSMSRITPDKILSPKKLRRLVL